MVSSTLRPLDGAGARDGVITRTHGHAGDLDGIIRHDDSLFDPITKYVFERVRRGRGGVPALDEEDALVLVEIVPIAGDEEF